MIVHVVVMKFKDKAHAQEVKRRLDALPAQIEQIRQYEIGINELESGRAFDLSLYSTFESYAAMDEYQVHPAHQDALTYIRSVLESAHSVDYTLP